MSDYDERDDDESSDEYVEENPKKKRKTDKGHGVDLTKLLDIEAEVSEDEEEMDEVESIDEDFVAKDVVDDTVDQNEDAKRINYMALNNRRSEDRAVEEISRAIERRHENYYTADDVEDETQMTSAISQQARQPSVNDPHLWIVKCKNGMEREIARTLLQKWATRQNDGRPLNIYSVVTLDHLKGYIYIEADRDGPVKEAIEHIDGIYASSKIVLVKLHEMTSVLTVPKKKTELKRGAWVRIKRGKYHKDLAQVYDYEEVNQMVWVRIIPRLDLEDLLKKDKTDRESEDSDDYGAKKTEEKKKAPAAATAGGTKEKKKEPPRPPARFFNPDEYPQLESNKKGKLDPPPRFEATGDSLQIFNGQLFKDGFLFKKISIKNLQIDGVRPSLEEFNKFQGPAGDDDEEDLGYERNVLKDVQRLNNQNRRPISFKKGDCVIVSEGDLKNLVGIVQSVSGDIVQVLPKHKELNDNLPIQKQYLQKYFRMGDHVKVLHGQYENETGLIVKLADNIAVLLSDVSQRELKVLTSDLQECAEVSTGLKFGDYVLYDLVQLDQNTVGILIRIEHDNAQVLDQNDQIRTVKAQGIRRKIDSKKAIGRDVDGNGVGAGDSVTVIKGTYENEKGVVKHIYRQSLFLSVKSRPNINGGVVVTRTKLCRLQGISKNRQQAAAMGKSGPFQHYSARPIQRQRKRRNDELLHKTVSITRGPWKGYIGLVKDTDDSNATVELQTNAKRITVLRDHLMFLDERNERNEPREDFDGSKTPLHRPGDTPLRVSTPHRPSTPSHDPFNPQGPQTPSYPSIASYTDDYDQNEEVSNNYPSSNQNSSFSRNDYEPAPTPGTPGGHFDNFREESHPPPHTPHTPGVNNEWSSHPQTPGGDTSYQPPHTPMDTYNNLQTPHTPGGEMYPPATPVDRSILPSTPAVPGTPGIFNDNGYNDDSDEETLPSGWMMPMLEVIVDETYPNPKYANQVGHILSVEGDVCTLRLPKYGDIKTNAAYLVPVRPEKNDRVIVLKGKSKGQQGIIKSTDDKEGVVQIDDKDITVLKLHCLAKIIINDW